MTAQRSRIVVTGEGTGVRARLVPDATGAPVIELTQLERHRDGYTAERARAFVPIEFVEDFTSALTALRAAVLLEQAPSERRLQVKPKKPVDPRAAYRRHQSEGF